MKFKIWQSTHVFIGCSAFVAVHVDVKYESLSRVMAEWIQINQLRRGFLARAIACTFVCVCARMCAPARIL
jgi:hypothetical protein